ncbi:tetratricopeptide repeat protein [Flavobacterium sp. NRK1]|uniref:tetratricopeptide repeat protein n=1 Tax=Flavobacterium sp. NRK1 TaxID=2954929 RepID=UPI0020933295|nr:tetratricopeptide repeat protein [Flavobacterium sp. NRK1]MCO6149447.1 tetratricopeptide repeat protein [Flavobacterium sp. NRK1]
MAQFTPEPIDECQRSMNRGAVEYKKGNYIEALQYFIKAQSLVDKNNYKKLFNIKNIMGICYGYLSNYGEALNVYSEAMEIAEEHHLLEDQVNVMCNIGILYSLEKDYKSAITIYKEAFKIANAINSDYSKTLLAVNISDVYNHLGNYKQAQFYLKSVENLKKEKQFEQLYNINYAESLLIQGKVNGAHEIMRQLEGKIPANLACYICVVELLSKIFDAKNNNAVAISYAQKGFDNATDMSDKLKLYNQLSSLYSKKREYDKALKYKDRFDQQGAF